VKKSKQGSNPFFTAPCPLPDRNDDYLRQRTYWGFKIQNN